MLRTLAVVFFAIFLLGTIADAAANRKLRNPKIIETARATAERAVALEWDEGARRMTQFLTEEADDLDIKRVKLVNGAVVEMDVVVNLMIGETSEGSEREYSAKCEVHLEKYDGIFEANYALCVTEDGEEIEYEH